MAKKINRSINPDASKRFSNRKKRPVNVDEMVKGIRSGDRVILSQAITYIESESPQHQAIAQQLIERCLPFANQSLRIGITGSPGVGKSTFIEATGNLVIQKEHKLAVLAVDPSSQISRGSILGDKTRMQLLAADERAFIRPSPAGVSLGGVTQKTRETIILCEAAGFDLIFIETVGVGQSEIAVHSMVDCFLLLLLPGAGDDLQGIKRGIVEMADLVIVNKADESRKALAKESMSAYKNALHLFPPKENNWIPKVLACSALELTGIDSVWENILVFKKHSQENGSFEQNRIEQSKFWLYESINIQLKAKFYNAPGMAEKMKAIEKAVMEGKVSPFRAAGDVVKEG